MKKKSIKRSRSGVKGQKTGRGAKVRRKLTIPLKHRSVAAVQVIYKNMFDYLMWTQQVDKAVAKVQGMRLNKALRKIMLRVLFILLSFTAAAQPNLSEIRVAPLPEPPVDSKVIIVSPSSDVKRAIETAQAGTTVKFNAGKYYLKAIHVPVKVNVDLGTAEVVATEPGQFNEQKNPALFYFRSTPASPGDQWIRGGTITGENKASGAILIDGRNNIQISGIKFRDFTFFGLWVKNSSNGEAHTLDFLNTSGATNSWAAGELCIFNLTNWDIHHVKLKTTVPTRGYGIKALYGGGYLNNVRFANIETDLNHQSAWNNGASHNIGIELHDTILQGTITIENCTIRNQLSLACINPNPGKVVVRNNLFEMGNDRYSIEGIVNNLEVYGNTFKNSSQWIFNGKPTIKVSNWMVYNNTYDQGTAPTMSWGGVFLFGANGGQGITIKDNKIRHKSGNEVLKFQGTSGGVNDIRSQNQITTF